MGFDLLLLGVEVDGDLGEVLVASFDVDPGDDVRGEVDDLFQVLRRQVEQIAEPAGHALEVPDVRDWGGKLDVPHPVAPYLRSRYLDPAPLADDPLEADALVLAAMALPVTGGPEDPLAEQAVLLGLQGPVVDGLRLLDLAVRPRPDLVRGGQADPQLIEVVDVKHATRTPPSGSLVGSPVWCWLSSIEVRPGRLAPGEVDAQLLRGTEHVLVGLAHLDLLALR